MTQPPDPFSSLTTLETPPTRRAPNAWSAMLHQFFQVVPTTLARARRDRRKLRNLRG